MLKPSTKKKGGAKIRERRKTLGMSLRDLARQIRCGVSTASQWENGKTYPHPHYTLALEKVLNLDSPFSEFYMMGEDLRSSARRAVPALVECSLQLEKLGHLDLAQDARGAAMSLKTALENG